MGNEIVRHGPASSGDMESGKGLVVLEDFRRAVESRRIVGFFGTIFPKGYEFGEPRVEAERLLRLLPVERAKAVARELSGGEPMLASIVGNISLVGVAGVAKAQATKWGARYGRDKYSDPIMAKIEDVEAELWSKLYQISELAGSIERSVNPGLFS